MSLLILRSTARAKLINVASTQYYSYQPCKPATATGRPLAALPPFMPIPLQPTPGPGRVPLYASFNLSCRKCQKVSLLCLASVPSPHKWLA